MERNCHILWVAIIVTLAGFGVAMLITSLIIILLDLVGN